MQAGSARFQRAKHDAVARENQTSQKGAIGVHRLDGDGRAYHDDDQRARWSARKKVVARANHGHPAVAAQA